MWCTQGSEAKKEDDCDQRCFQVVLKMVTNMDQLERERTKDSEGGAGGGTVESVMPDVRPSLQNYTWLLRHHFELRHHCKDFTFLYVYGNPINKMFSNFITVLHCKDIRKQLCTAVKSWAPKRYWKTVALNQPLKPSNKTSLEIAPDTTYSAMGV